ncbi:MAG TPA: hypothetical protein VIK69_10320 [Methylophilaceae bacterium]
MTDDIKLLPLPSLDIVPSVEPVDYPGVAQALMDYARDNVAYATTTLQAEVEALREALKEIRSRSSMNLAMNPNPYELTALLGDIHQIADAALAQENKA